MLLGLAWNLISSMLHREPFSTVTLQLMILFIHSLHNLTAGAQPCQQLVAVSVLQVQGGSRRAMIQGDVTSKGHCLNVAH